MVIFVATKSPFTEVAVDAKEVIAVRQLVVSDSADTHCRIYLKNQLVFTVMEDFKTVVRRIQGSK